MRQHLLRRAEHAFGKVPSIQAHQALPKFQIGLPLLRPVHPPCRTWRYVGTLFSQLAQNYTQFSICLPPPEERDKVCVCVCMRAFPYACACVVKPIVGAGQKDPKAPTTSLPQFEAPDKACMPP